jgi:ABC-type phosphate/phosphonate transport system permease subunit
MNLLFFAIATVGLTNILVESKIAKPIRWAYDKAIGKTSPMIQDWLGGLFDCHMCCGLWSGLICSQLVATNWLETLAAGFAGSLLSSVMALVLEVVAYVRDWLMSAVEIPLDVDGDSNG